MLPELRGAPARWTFQPPDLAMAVTTSAMDGYLAEIAVQLQPEPSFHLAPAGVVSAAMTSPEVRTFGFSFEGDPESLPGTGRAKSLFPSLDGVRSGRCASRQTRIRPPRDIVKLEDRLRLLLQPPLESLLSIRDLRFPNRPFDYQLDGIAFLYPRHEAVLADEMGLGKTMQAVTAIRLLAHQGVLRQVLLICPKPLVRNWQHEFNQWAPELPVLSVEGTAARRRWLWRESRDLVMITNYESLLRDHAEICGRKNDFDLVVLDEAQRIKNLASATSEAVRKIPRRRSWALTGTPIENRLDDLVGIFEFVAPGQIPARQQPRTIRRSVADYVLRRTKDQVLPELPPKLYRDALVELSPEQAASYERAEKEGVIRLREMKQELTITHVFELVLRLKQICNFDPLTGSSSKLERLEADVEECAASGRKAIIFSQWVETLLELRRALARFGAVEYHGRIAAGRRHQALERFRNDDDCRLLLITYGAGGVGLNLQFASYVFLFDRWWNPAVEDQAINRAHRIGAKDAVTVTRFLTLNTIEQRIDEILERKRALVEAVLGDPLIATHHGLSREEIFSLFRLDPGDWQKTA